MPGSLLASLREAEDTQDPVRGLTVIDPVIQGWGAVELVHGDVEPPGICQAQRVRPPQPVVVLGQGLEPAVRV